MGDVVTHSTSSGQALDVETTLPIPVSRILDDAKDLTEVIVIGWDADDTLYVSASHGSLGNHLILLERAKLLLLGQATSEGAPSNA